MSHELTMEFGPWDLFSQGLSVVYVSFGNEQILNKWRSWQPRQRKAGSTLFGVTGKPERETWQMIATPSGGIFLDTLRLELGFRRNFGGCGDADVADDNGFVLKCKITG
ncbi:hypothetical protein Patl1_18968 [Pistacia atlantica]|uniref:Uncharacterized protein n=1 Tax=Pistacia atlantica TaxID=434234 RepID=A0ACC1BZJ5_9ROSI|nr:hypothetical protein Patl1_18968 [Pistacia atlantica]